MNGDRVTIIEPNGVQRSRPIGSAGLTVGRGDESDLVINYAAVSRNHALISYDRGRYYVIDLGSANGTYMGNVRLEANTPTPWEHGQPLRIGDVQIQLQRAGSADARTNTFVGFRPEAEQGRVAQGKSDALKWILAALLLAILLVAVVILAYSFLA